MPYNFVFRTLALMLSLATSCTSAERSNQSGMQDDFRGFVPARVAVLACRPWPAAAFFEDFPLSNAPPSQWQETCSKIDQYVLDGFRNQPYMRGFSPSAVEKLLEKSPGGIQTTEIAPLWTGEGKGCPDCQGPVDFYQTKLAADAAWRLWLQKLSSTARHADAILIPMIVSLNEFPSNDRGLLAIVRTGSVVLFLVDAASGRLIWTGRRRALVKNQALADFAGGPALQPPSWELLTRRILVNDLWREFPGRQNQ